MAIAASSPQPDSAPARCPVWGICEVFGWVTHFDRKYNGHEVEDCLQAHLNCGVRHISWALGRSAMDYQTRVGTPWGYYSKQYLPEHETWSQMMKQRCMLRAAVDFANANDMVLYGRLCMNRNYGPTTVFRSRFAEENRQFHDVSKEGVADHSRLCYFFPEVRAERVELLVEAAEKGIHGIQLDFCRQPPMIQYHPKMCEAYRAHAGVDPRQIRSIERDSFLPWAKWRAGLLTEMMRDLKRALDPVRKRLGRRIPVQARVTDLCPEITLINGVDLAVWLEESLIDEIMLDPLEWVLKVDVHNPHLYVDLARPFGVPVYGGVSGSPPKFFRQNPIQIARRARELLRAGCAGIGVYQTDILVTDERDPRGRCFDLRWLLPQLGDAAALDAILSDRTILDRFPITYLDANCGIDNHSPLYAHWFDVVHREDSGFKSPKIQLL